MSIQMQCSGLFFSLDFSLSGSGVEKKFTIVFY